MSVGLNRLQRETDPEGRAAPYQGSSEVPGGLREHGGSQADGSAPSSAKAPKGDDCDLQVRDIGEVEISASMVRRKPAAV